MGLLIHWDSLYNEATVRKIGCAKNILQFDNDVHGRDPGDGVVINF